MPRPHSPAARPKRQELCVEPNEVHPPPEDELGGGDICSVEEQPSTDDDRPLD